MKDLILRYIHSLMESTPERPLWNQEVIREGKPVSWNYIDGCMMTAFLRLYDQTGETLYMDFVKNYIDFFVEEDGYIKTYNPDEFNLDNINEGRALFSLYDRFGDARYLKALDGLYGQIKKQPRTKEGSFWHKKIYPHQVWLDGLYMAQPFYLEYEKRFNNKAGYEDIYNQFKTVKDKMKDKETGLFYHAWDSSHTMFWGHPETGCSPHFWLRALGWFYMAMVDLLELLDPASSRDADLYTLLKTMFTELTDVLIAYQSEGGMWYQIIGQEDRSPNYPETSGTAILAYGMLKAVDMGILTDNYKSYGKRAFRGICETYLAEEEGRMNLGGTCLVAGLGGPGLRNGSFEYYMSEPVVENEAKGIAPFLLAYLYM